MERVIEVRGIKKAFGDHEVLRAWILPPTRAR